MAGLFDAQYSVNINVTDTLPTRADLRTYSIVGEAVAFSRDRVDVFTSKTDLALHYPAYTKVNKKVSASFAGALSVSRNTPTIKVIGKLNVFNFAIDNVIDSTTYTATVGGEDITYTSGVGATADEIKQGLVLAIDSSNQGQDVRGAAGVGDDFDVFMRKKNQSVTNSDVNMTLTSRLETLTEVLTAALGSFYFFTLTSKAQADVIECASFASTETVLFGYSTEQGVAKTSSATGIMGVLGAGTSPRTFGIWSHQAGVDFTNASGIISAGFVTFTTTAPHGIKTGDLVTLNDVAVDSVVSSDINKEHTAAVTSATEFTVPTTEAGTVTTPGTGFAHALFPESVWIGRNVTGLEGAESWAKDNLAGIIPSDDFLDGSNQTNITEKNGNFYYSVGGVGETVASTPKYGGILHSGGFIDTQWGVDTLKIRVQEALHAISHNTGGIPFTAEGLAKVASAILSAGSELFQNGFLTLTNGLSLEVFMPNVNDIPAADKINRVLRNIVVNGTIAGKIHSFNITINLAP